MSWEYLRCPRVSCHMRMPILWGRIVESKWLQEWQCQRQWQWRSLLLLSLLTPFPAPPSLLAKIFKNALCYIYFMTDCIGAGCWLFPYDLYKTCLYQAGLGIWPPLSSHIQVRRCFTQWLQSDILESRGCDIFHESGICGRCYWQTLSPVNSPQLTEQKRIESVFVAIVQL